MVIGPQHHILSFLVLDLTFDMVLGMPWLRSSNVRVNWTNGSVQMRRGSRWVELPSRFEGVRQYIDMVAADEPR